MLFRSMPVFTLRLVKASKEIDMSKFLEIIAQPSTWRGLTWILTAIGVNISPDTSNAVIASGMAVAGLIGTLTSDK